MHAFNDENSSEWRLSLTYAALKRMRSAGLDVFDFVCLETCDFEKLVRILWCWLEPQIEQRGIDEEQFAECLGGDAIATSYLAIRDEVLDFLSHTNPPLAIALRKARDAANLLMARAENAAASISLSSNTSV